MRYSSLILVSLLAYISEFELHATEVDSFTDRQKVLSDSAPQINTLLNSYFKTALTNANLRRSCNREVIEEALIKQIKKPFWSKVEDAILQDKKFEKRHTLFENSIYRDFTMFEAPALHMAELGPIIRVGSFYVGSDKIGHFLQTGYEMFMDHHEEEDAFRNTLAWSEWTERTYYGSLTTGVYSYGDLAANYDGLYFWERVANVRLPFWETPYFQCEKGIWVQTAQFDINSYVNAAWDEGNNCNSYKTSVLEEKVAARVRELEKATGQNLTCPIQPVCRDMIERYGNVASHVITPKCFP